MSCQRLTLNEQDFIRLVRDELVRDGNYEIALQNISDEQKLQAIAQSFSLAPAITHRDDTEEIRRWLHGVNQAFPQNRGSFLCAAPTRQTISSCARPFCCS